MARNTKMDPLDVFTVIVVLVTALWVTWRFVDEDGTILEQALRSSALNFLAQ